MASLGGASRPKTPKTPPLPGTPAPVGTSTSPSAPRPAPPPAAVPSSVGGASGVAGMSGFLPGHGTPTRPDYNPQTNRPWEPELPRFVEPPGGANATAATSFVGSYPGSAGAAAPAAAGFPGYPDPGAGPSPFDIWESQQAKDLAALQAKLTTETGPSARDKWLADIAKRNQDAAVSAFERTRPETIAAPSEVDDAAAEAALFARAKDTAALSTQAGLQSLRDEMAGRGISGSGIEAARSGYILGGGTSALGEASREQAVQALTRARQVRDRNYEGAITQRGQDVGLVPSLLALFNRPALAAY